MAKKTAVKKGKPAKAGTKAAKKKAPLASKKVAQGKKKAPKKPAAEKPATKPVVAAKGKVTAKMAAKKKVAAAKVVAKSAAAKKAAPKKAAIPIGATAAMHALTLEGVTAAGEAVASVVTLHTSVVGPARPPLKENNMVASVVTPHTGVVVQIRRTLKYCIIEPTDPTLEREVYGFRKNFIDLTDFDVRLKLRDSVRFRLSNSTTAIDIVIISSSDYFGDDD